MKAILDDLTMEDNFSIIDFNHNVRCWNEDLVPGSPLHAANAKTYIETIKPNGGPRTRASFSYRDVFCCVTSGSNPSEVYNCKVTLVNILLTGTNINEALLRAVHMLTRASSQGLTNPRSISMIILVSDGDPTVGKNQTEDQKCLLLWLADLPDWKTGSKKSSCL